MAASRYRWVRAALSAVLHVGAMCSVSFANVYSAARLRLPILPHQTEEAHALGGVVYLTAWNMPRPPGHESGGAAVRRERFRMKGSPWPWLLHALAVLHFAFGILYALSFVTFPRGMMPDALRDIGWKKFLTFWNMCLQSVYFTIALLNDIAGSNEIAPKSVPLLRKIKDYMLCTVAFPVSMFVGLTFWGLYAVDRELVFPTALDPYFPSWLNHVMHTNIMIFTILEMILSFRKYPSRNSGTGGLTAFMVVYLVWTFIIYFYSGAWVYPVLEVLNWGQRVIFFLGLLLFVNALYFMGEFLNTIVWGKELMRMQAKSSSKRKKSG